VLDKLSISQLVELSNFSKSYISQVKNGKRPPSKKLLNSIRESYQPLQQKISYFNSFINSREAMGVSPRTVEFYQDRLGLFIDRVDYVRASRSDIRNYLNSIPPNKYGLATRHASFRAIKTFYRWLNTEFGIKNPIEGMPAPILGKPILPSLTQGEVLNLLDEANCVRDKAIIALFTESGLRLTELANIRIQDIVWANRTIRVLGKGRKEALAAFGTLTEQYLKEWLTQYRPKGNIWGMNNEGIRTMLRRLQQATGLLCNPHTFRRTFACLLRKAGVDTMTIKDLGRWESLEMVQRYTRSVTFEDSLKHYKAPLSQ